MASEGDIDRFVRVFVKIRDEKAQVAREAKEKEAVLTEELDKFILKHEIPDLLDKRINQGNMRQFLEENPEQLPPGLNVDREYAVTVRRK